MLLPRIFSAQFTSFRPNTMDIRAEEPTPMSEPKAWMMFMMGMVMARPAMARAPTPCPMKMRSTILYIEAIIWLMTEGNAYIHSKSPILFVSNSLVLSITSTIFSLQGRKNTKKKGKISFSQSTPWSRVLLRSPSFGAVLSAPFHL